MAEELVKYFIDGKHSPAVELVMEYQEGKMNDDQLIEALLAIDYEKGPRFPSDVTDQSHAQWYADVEEYDYTGPGTWGELDSMVRGGILPEHIMQALHDAAAAKDAG